MERKDDMLTLEQAAEYAGVKLRTVQWAAQKGYLDTLPIPSRFKLTTREAVDRWMRSERKRASRVAKL